jgi:hypothetical protein
VRKVTAETEVLAPDDVVLAPDYEDLTLWEVLGDPVLFQEYLLPDPQAVVSAQDYMWDGENERQVWYFQYPFLMWPLLNAQCGRAVGKALACSTPLPTPTGWTTMGKVQVGDLLLDEQRNPCRVTFVTPVQQDRKCFTVRCSDGTSIVADAHHLWALNRPRDGKPELWATVSLFRAAHKRDKQYFPGVAYGKYVESVERTASVPVRCLQVDSSNHLYLAGKGMIPTHNTTIGMQGGTAYDLVNFPQGKSAVLGPSQQHTMRVFDEITNLLLDYRYLRFWLSEDQKRTGLRQADRKIRARNGWSLNGLIPGKRGIGFKGEHPNRSRGDEAQDITPEGWEFLVDLITPFDAIGRRSLEHYYGVPDGNRISTWARMCHDKKSRWAQWKRQVPSFLSPLMSRDSWVQRLVDSQCTFEVLADGRIVVVEYSNAAKRNILGMWGDPVSPCFPPSVYQANTRPAGVPHYSHLLVNPGLINASGIPGEDLMVQLLLTTGGRDRFPKQPTRIFVAVDPGPNFCSVTVWGKFPDGLSDHKADWWCLQRIEITNIMDTNLLTAIIDRIANFWQANWIGSDSTSQSVYVADWLMNEQLFGFHNRLRLVYRSEKVTTNAWDPVEIGKAKGWVGQVVVPVFFNGNMPSDYTHITIPGKGVEWIPEMKDSDVFTVRVLQMLMAQEKPRLLLPTEEQDLDMYSEVTSYSETVSPGSKRFDPPHPHMVSTMKVFAAMVYYAELLDVPQIDSGPPAYAGALPLATNLHGPTR